MPESSLTYRTEKFLRKLAGMADLEDALKKLDRLTQEEARMANAEVLRIAHHIRDGVKIVDGKVGEVVDKVQCVDDKVQVVIGGAQTLSSQLRSFLTYMLSDGKHARVAAKEIRDKLSDVGVEIEDMGQDVGDRLRETSLVIQQVANDVDEIKCS